MMAVGDGLSNSTVNLSQVSSRRPSHSPNYCITPKEEMEHRQIKCASELLYKALGLRLMIRRTVVYHHNH
ncbi:hypothetical protein TNCV_1350001 [Trichonephila clavipes]|nr:hypothetical protein TNCV_1350001 [Trichonephila clavipes]